MAEHLNDHALQRKLVPGEYAEKHKTHVADTRISHQSFQVSLSKGEHGPVKNADYTDQHRPWRNLKCGPRE